MKIESRGRVLPTLTLVPILLVPLLPMKAFGQVRESILFLEPDGRHAFGYSTYRTPEPGFNFYLPKGESLDTFFKDVLYFYPNDFTFDTTTNAQYDLLHFKTEGMGALSGPVDLDTLLTVSPDGEYRLDSWKRGKGPEGHYGDWHTPGNWVRWAGAWVLPADFEFTGYECNREGEWILRRNTLAFYAEDVNDVVCTVRYQPRTQALYNALKDALGGLENVEVQATAGEVSVTLPDTVLFTSGSAEISTSGVEVLSGVARTLAASSEFRVAVEGHTDNVPITGGLAETYSSNWELSAARAVAVLRHLAESGIEESRLEVRAYGSQRPRASNDTVAGRAANRRIELRVAVIEPRE